MQIDGYIPITRAKTKLLDMIRNFDDREDTIVITKNGVPKAVLMSIEQYEAMCETMEILADKSLMTQIRQSEDEINRKEALIDLEDIL